MTTTPRRRRRTPLLMSAHSELDAADVVGPGGRIVLTPSADDGRDDHAPVAESHVAYTAMLETPPAADHRLGARTSARALEDGDYAVPLGPSSAAPTPHGSERYHLRATGYSSRHGDRDDPTVAAGSGGRLRGLSARALRVWHFVADMIFASCLLVAMAVRVNAVSVAYLVIFCYGIVQSFDSAALTLVTMLVSALTCVGHIVVAVLFQAPDRPWNGDSIARIFGLERWRNAKDVATHVGVDALVLVCSLVHYFYVLRRLRKHKAQGVFDIFDVGVNILQQFDAHRHRKHSSIQWVELLCTILLFLTSMAVPSFAAMGFYLVLLQRLLQWTVYAKRIVVDDFLRNEPRIEFFLGLKVARLLLVYSFFVILAWYTLQMNELSSRSTIQRVITYAGFADFARGERVPWQYYVFASCQLLFFISLARLVNLHQSLQLEEEVFHLSSPEASSQHQSGQRVSESGSRNEDDPIEATLVARVRALPFHVRVFLRDGGSLLASAAAIAWCVSYPSYASTPMMTWALFTLGVYGWMPSLPLIWVLIAYGTGLAITEYSVNLTYVIVVDDHTKYGLKMFDYPFLDLGVHNLCLVVIYVSIRTRRIYQEVLDAEKLERERSKTTENPDVERNSLDTFRDVADMRKNLHASWSQVLPLWLTDAKQVVFTHLDALVLVTIVAVALSTRVSFFQTGYLMLAVVLMLFFQQRRRLWRILLAYALIICLAVFVRNIDCHKSERLDLVGLICYDSSSFTWASLWPTLFTAQLAIIFQLVFQLVVYVSNEEAINERIRTMDQSHQNPLYFVSRIAVEVDNAFRIIGSVVTYVAFLVVAFEGETNKDGQTTIIGVIQLAILFVILGGHLGKFKSAPRTSLRLKLLWFCALLIEVTILILRYLYQFEDVSQYLEEMVFTSRFFSAQDFGLENHSSKSSLSGVFFYLLPTAVVMVLTFWQLASIMKPVNTYNFLAPGRSKFIDRILFGIDTIRQVVIAFSTTALVLVAMSMAIREINAIGALYVAILVIGRPLSSWKKLWFPLFWVSVVGIVSTYVYQLRTFETFNADDASRSKHLSVDLGGNAEWFGLHKVVDHRRTPLWKLVSGELLVLLLCFFQRLAQYHEGKASKPHASMEPIQSESRTDSGAVDGGSGSPTAQYVVAPTPVIQAPANAFDDGSDDSDFITCLRNFCIEYASHASVNVVMLLLMASSFFHRDIISIVFMLAVYAIMYAAPHNVCRLWFLLAFAVSSVILGEYFIIVWLPPAAGVDKQRVDPWKSVQDSYQQWFAVDDQHKWALLADFVTLLAIYMLPQSSKLRQYNDNFKVSIHSEHLSKQLSHSSSRIRLNEEARCPGSFKELGPSEYINKTQTLLWYSIEYIVLFAWLPASLLVVFVAGAGNGGFASLMYIWAAVWMLYRLDDARHPSCAWIQRLRKWNWLHLFVMVVVNAPFIQKHITHCFAGSNEVDISSMGKICLSFSNLFGIEANRVPYGIIAIFIMISIHCEMLSTSSYQEMWRFQRSQLRLSGNRRLAIVRDFYRQRTAQWYAMKKDKSAALQRLKIIVSKLVHKVEELMDIAMGLHHSLPPMAPSQPLAIGNTQNSVTICWQAPPENVHRIRFYRITRQQYPSLTLLGDFADLVEVKGDVTTTTIEGLRPGTSYQFRVAAVSRMGEGPFSVPSDPVETFSLNLDGSCTAGWMKYRRESLASSRFSLWFAWLQPKYLHRYVVLDTHSLVFYRNEEVALRHRSKRRRKKIKTSFRWGDVMQLRLSDEKVQFDDMSPLLYCFELTVRGRDSSDADRKYVFQVDNQKEFNRFLSAMAFSVPRHTVDESILACLREKKLPEPALTYTDGDDTELNDKEETASELSSNTGDESSFGDPEDEDFDSNDSTWLAWRVPLYRFFYFRQDAALRAETTFYDVDDQCEPSLGEILTVIVHAVRSCSAEVCYFFLVLSFANQADILNLMNVVITFCYLIVENPRPAPSAWHFLLKYTCAILVIRYLFQLAFFCQGLGGNGLFYPSIQPYCGPPSNSVLLEAKPVQPLVYLGIYKFDGSVLRNVDNIFTGLQWNFYVAVAILWHRRELTIRGLWIGEALIIDANEVTNEWGRQQGNGSDISSRDSIDETFTYGGPSNRFLQHHDGGTPNSSIATPTITRGSSTKSEKQEGQELAEELLEELETEDNASKSTHSVVLEGQEKREQNAEITENEAIVNSVSEQVNIEDDDEDHKLISQKPTWSEKRFPQLAHFFRRVVCIPPAQWDTDIHAAIEGAKPGRDLYTSSLTVLLIASIFAVIFFKQIGEPDPGANGGAISKSSMVSGYLVLIVLIELCFAIWDRAAYVCHSLRSKLVLQYTYLVLLHICLWLLIPWHTDIYFQKRPALVLFYVLHCAYLWLGALQIRYGYPVYEGSRYNYTARNAYTRIREKVFPLVMLAPFLFEMRALLDYVCTKTSLSWQHWIMLEETAAHLFEVKMEMRGRVDDAEVLQGKRRQPWYKKMLSAGVMLLLLLLCLIGPLALFSSANPSTKPNRVTRTEVTFGIEDSRGTINKLYTGIDINSPSYEGDQIAQGAVMQRITYDTFSRDVWSSSPPYVKRLISQLKSDEVLNWLLSLSFTRPGPTDHQTIETSYRIKLSASDREKMITMIQLTSLNTTEKESASITVEGILPPLVQMTATDGVIQRSKVRRSISLAKHSVQGASWWSVEPLLRQDALKSSSDTDREFCDETSPFCLIGISDNVVQGLSTIGISSYGITAVYFFVLVTIGSAVKGFFRGALFQIQYTELPDPDDVLELVEGVYIARNERYIGHLKDEVRIFETLVRVLRSPETLTKVTGSNVIHIPKAKEKLE